MPVEAEEIPKELKTRYSGFSFLGSGAMGRVFKAYDIALLKEVAIKLLLTNETPETLVRFQREAQTASKLRHPNLVTIMNFGSTGGDQFYLVMEYANGITLASLLEKGPLSLVNAVSIISQVCDGMSHAHARGVVHRDLKPANIIVDGDNLFDAKVKVVDFGIAKLDQSSSSAHTVTPKGSVLGTPLYMSPEQISSKEIDGRSDIYSTGCILFHLLTGKLPHEGDSTMELMQAKLTKVAPRINANNRKVHVPVEVEDVVARCLSVSPDDRFSTMAELKEALIHAVHTSKTVAASPEMKTTSNAKIYGSFAVAVLLILGIVVAVVAGRLNQAESQPPEPVELAPMTVFKDNKLTETTGVDGYFRQDEKDSTSWIGHNDVTDEAVAKLLKNIGEQVLDLELENQQKITPLTFRSIAKFPKLESLTIADSAFNDACARYLGDSKSITKLNLSGTALSDTALASLTKMPIDDLNIESTNVTDEGMKSIAKMKRLTRLEVAHIKIGNDGLKLISKLPLQCLHVESTKVDDYGMKFLSGNKVLERFYCESTTIGEAGLRQIASCRITELSLDGCSGVDDRCIDFITRTWPDMIRIAVSDTSITPAGTKCIWKLKRLTELKLNGLRLSDDDIAPIVQLKQLEKITLRDSPITDKTLERLSSLPRLRKIELTNCRGITENGITKLQKQLPNLKIAKPEKDVQEPGFIDALIRED